MLGSAGRSFGNIMLKLAEEVRFELTEAINLDGFQDRCLKPLGHSSINGGVY